MQPERTACLIFLLLGALWDIRTRCIHLRLTAAFAALGILLAFVSPRTAGEVMWALVPGLVLLAASALSRGAIGMGDGITLAVTGLYLDLPEVMFTAGFAFAGAALMGILMLLLKKRGESFPFLPFLFFGEMAAFMLI